MTVDVQRTSSEADDGTDIEFLASIKFWQWVTLLNTYALRAEVCAVRIYEGYALVRYGMRQRQLNAEVLIIIF